MVRRTWIELTDEELELIRSSCDRLEYVSKRLLADDSSAQAIEKTVAADEVFSVIYNLRSFLKQ